MAVINWIGKGQRSEKTQTWWVRWWVTLQDYLPNISWFEWKFRVTSSCEFVVNCVSKSWSSVFIYSHSMFVSFQKSVSLPVVMIFYARRNTLSPTCHETSRTLFIEKEGSLAQWAKCGPLPLETNQNANLVFVFLPNFNVFLHFVSNELRKKILTWRVRRINYEKWRLVSWWRDEWDTQEWRKYTKRLRPWINASRPQPGVNFIFVTQVWSLNCLRLRHFLHPNRKPSNAF